MKTIQLIGTCVVAATLLAACGGGDDDFVPPADTTKVAEVPASAGANSVAFTQYGMTQVLAVSETDEPLGTDKISVAPTSETDEPATL